MTREFSLTFLLLCASSVSLTGAATPQTAPKKSKVPPAVQKTVDEQSQGAKIRGLSKEIENRKTQYELELTINGRARDMIIDRAGTILLVEEEITLDTLTSAVRAEIEKNIGQASLLRLESVTKSGTLTGYEALISKAGKKAAIEMRPDGKLIPVAKK